MSSAVRAAAGSGAHHGVPVDVAAALVSALVGVAVVLIFVALAGLTRQERTRAVFFTVGYPWYLVMFAITLFLPDAVSLDADLS